MQEYDENETEEERSLNANDTKSERMKAMPSALAERIISTWEKVLQEKNEKIPQYESFENLRWGVLINREGTLFMESGDCFCPLGAMLSGREVVPHSSISFISSLVEILDLENPSWVFGFLSARRGEKPQKKYKSDRITPAFEEGWNVALEILEWTHTRNANTTTHTAS